MAATHTITISSRRSGVDPNSTPACWVVQIDGHEFTHGNHHALPFATPEEAAQFVADLRADHGPDAVIEVVGLDALGLPIAAMVKAVAPAVERHWDDAEPSRPSVRTAWEQTMERVADALFLNAPASHRIEVVAALWRHDLLPRQLRELKQHDPAFAVARLKAVLPQEFVQYAAWRVGLRRLLAAR